VLAYYIGVRKTYTEYGERMRGKGVTRAMSLPLPVVFLFAFVRSLLAMSASRMLYGRGTPRRIRPGKYLKRSMRQSTPSIGGSYADRNLFLWTPMI